jgi:PAS domain S-box-containing protein
MVFSSTSARTADEDQKKQAIRREQVRLLYGNARLAVAVNVLAAFTLAYLQRNVISHPVILGWLAYSLIVAAARYGLDESHRRLARSFGSIGWWSAMFLTGAALAGIGWGAAAILLYPPSQLINQVLLAFVLGGMMAGASSVLAAQSGALLVFILPPGLMASMRFFLQGDDLHIGMGWLALIYTAATLMTANRINATIVRSLKLRLENSDLVADLQSSNRRAETLNAELEAEILQRKQAAEALKRNEQRLELALFGTDMGLWDSDLQTGGLYLDQKGAAILGYEPGEVRPSWRFWKALVHAEDAAQMTQALRAHLDGETPFYTSEQRVRTKAGEWRWILARGKVVERDSAGRAIRITGTHRDVTERRMLMDELRTSRQALEVRVQERTAELDQAISQLREEITERKRAEQERAAFETHLHVAQRLEAVGVLAGGIAHDFNNILTSIIGFTRLAYDDLPADSPTRYKLEQVLRAGDRAADLVKRLLVFGRKGDQRSELVDVAAVVTEALALLRVSIPRNIEVRQQIDPHAGHILGDASLVEQVVMNLCTNAYQAMKGATGSIKVTLESVDLDSSRPGTLAHLEEGPYIRLTVSDTGPGIATDIADRVFEPFFTTKDVGQGTGLGLAVVHGVAARYGGSVTFESRPGHGTTFYVYLRRELAAQRSNERTPTLMPRGNEHILLVDDEGAIVRLATHMLKNLGYTVTARTSSEEAWELLMRDPEPFDLVITDFAMPRMTGDELIRRARNIRPDIPAILTSGFCGEAGPSEDVPDLALDGYIGKPFSPSTLALTVRKALDSRSGAR